MLDIPTLLAEELSLLPSQVDSALKLQSEGATVPFIARYRKEATGELDEVQLRALFDRHQYLTELQERKETVLKTIDEQGKLTLELKSRIESCLKKTELEDLYLPYKPKKRTRATVAREKGLEPLADFVKALNRPDAIAADLLAQAATYVSEEKGVASAEEALKGAADILAEEVSEKAELRTHIRNVLMEEGVFISRVKPEFAEGSTKYEMYRDYKCPVKDIPPHNMLALRRGEREGVLTFDIEFDEPKVWSYLEKQEIHASAPTVRSFYRELVADAFERLMQPSLMGEVRHIKRQQADEASIGTFEANLRNLLLASPAGMKPTLAIDPGFRTGCKVVVLDGTGKLLTNRTLYPHTGEGRKREAADMLRGLIEQHGIELIAIGNGTGGRETEEFVKEAIVELKQKKPVPVMVNEAGASVYSASEVAQEEFPHHDLTVRGAVSIGRRLQDPLAELVKVDPKSIGVGQYQHDVDQSLLAKKLGETVESCVNYVGVDLNTASPQLLKYVAGLTSAQAQEIVNWRNKQGPFTNREQLTEVPQMGPKTFEQAAGFLRIRGGDNPLDNTGVHPERYPLVEKIATDLNVPLAEITSRAEELAKVEVQKYVTEGVGEPTLRDILDELQKPGRDPREKFEYPEFKEGIRDMGDLEPGMKLEGVVTNVTEFGAFVDVGVHQDGLVHVSELADRFVRDPKEVVKVGEVVNVEVLEADTKRKRIGLSMRAQRADGQPRQRRPRRPRDSQRPRERARRSSPDDRQRGPRREDVQEPSYQPRRTAPPRRRRQMDFSRRPTTGERAGNNGRGSRQDRDRGRADSHDRGRERGGKSKLKEKTSGFTLEDLANKFNSGG